MEQEQESLEVGTDAAASAGAGRASSTRASRDARCAALEERHVHDVYARTSHHFAGVRYKAWPRVKKFLTELEPGSVVADVGCGNGRYLHINRSLYKLGSDRCEGLVRIAGRSGHEVMTCDNLRLPYRDACCDAVVSIGVIHHLTTPRRRAAAVTELARILRPGGKLMIYVWAMEQKHRNFDGQDVLVPWHLQPKPSKCKKKERSGGPRRELSSVSSFSDDEGVSEPCAAAAEISRQEEPPAPPPPRGPFTAASPMFLEAGIDPKCLQRNHSLPSPARRTSLTAAERSHSWDHTQTHEHTTALHLPKCPLACLNTAYIPPYAKCVSPPQQESISTSSQNSALDRTTKEMEASVPDPAAQIAGRCSFCEEVTAKTESPSEPEVKSNSISAAIKSKVIGFFQRSFSPKPNSSSSQEQSDLPRRSKAKDEEYRKLVEYIMREEAELLHCERPALEHTVSAPESSEVFAVREFPMSSQVLTRRKSRSLDEPPVIVPPRVRRKSRSLDEPPRIELLEESNESAEASDGEGDPEPLIEDKIMEAEQSCDSGNQSDSGAADPVVSEEPSSLGDLPSPAHTRNDSGTVVEENVTKEEDDDNDTADEMDRDKENDTADDESSSDSEEEEAGVEENGEECEREKVEKLNLEAAEPVECCETSAPRRRGSLPDGRVANIISDIVLPPERAARRSSLQSSHKKLSPVASTGSERSSAGEAETDCDEWARTTEAVIRSMQNQMLRRQSAIEDFIIDFDRFTTSSSGDSRLGQLTYEDISNGACSQSPPLPPRRGSEASTISSEGVSATESPSDVDDLDVWKSKADSPSEVSPDKAFQLPSHSFHVNGEKSSSSSSSNSPTESPPSGEQPTYHRFYHVFRQGELVDLIERHVDNLHVLSCYYDHANWCVIAEKVQVWRI